MPATETRFAKAAKIADSAKRTAALRKLASEVLALRTTPTAKCDGTWDSSNGLRANGYVTTAQQGRTLLRDFATRGGKKVDTGNGIAKSYVRDADFRAAESERRLAKTAAKKTAPKPRKPRKVAAQKKTANAGTSKRRGPSKRAPMRRADV